MGHYIAIILKPFNPTQRYLIKGLVVTFFISLLGMITMSVLGAEYESFHLFDLSKGIPKFIYDLFSTGCACSFFTLFGMYVVKGTDKVKISEDK